jgi:polyhydroxyalkanoate synthase
MIAVLHEYRRQAVESANVLGMAMQDASKEMAKVFNLAEMSVALSRMIWESARLINRYTSHQHLKKYPDLRDKEAIILAFVQLGTMMMANPLNVIGNPDRPWRDYLALWQSFILKTLGQAVDPVIAPKKSDKRFKYADWEEHLVFDYIKQSYLITSRYLHSVVAGVEGLDFETRKKVDFYTRQFIDAVAPTNFVMTNPQVLDKTWRTGGTNLVTGFANLLSDIERSGGSELRIKMTDPNAFKLGENIAVTKGKVIYQNELMQLLQYAPATQKVNQRPLLIIPPWINKFYILDLRKNNSFIKWAVDHGHTVFVISWVNPDAELADKDFEDYLLEGPLTALDVIKKATGETAINAIGYCLGGTLLASLLAYLAEKKMSSIVSATFFTTLIDFTDPGELSVFTDDRTLELLEARMKMQGYLDSHEMAHAFNLLRSNDLIWTFVVNNYLLGEQPIPFDLLYWNSDSTRMPAKMHSFYLRNMYRNNLLTKPNGIHLNGVPIDIRRIKIPCYFFSAVEDHIAPWKSTYAGMRLFSGPRRFVLGDAGHIAGVVNPPSAEKKYGYWSGDEMPEDPEQWLADARHHKRSWWEDWQHWITQYTGEKVARRMPGGGEFEPIEDAPGSYAKHRFDVVRPHGHHPGTLPREKLSEAEFGHKSGDGKSRAKARAK